MPGKLHAAGLESTGLNRRFGRRLSRSILISKKLQQRALLARSTLAPTLSEGHAWPFRGPLRERQCEQVGSLSRVLVGEGWGEGEGEGEGDPPTG